MCERKNVHTRRNVCVLVCVGGGEGGGGGGGAEGNTHQARYANTCRDGWDTYTCVGISS